MTRRPTRARARFQERGASLIELMIALVVLSLGILALARVFPAGSRAQLQDRMLTSGNLYAQEKVEQLQGLPWSAPALSLGRHPAGTASEDLGASGQWHRFYEISAMPAPFDNVRKLTVTVSWSFMGARSVQATTYLTQ